MHQAKNTKSLVLILTFVFMTLLYSCGGGSGGGSDNDSPSSYTISGIVSGDVQKGVTVTLSGTNSSTTTTDAGGNYSFSGLTNGVYTVTPSITGYSFNPISKEITINNVDSISNNFISAADSDSTFSISGTVTVGSTGKQGVTVTLSGAVSGVTTTDDNGNYSFSDLADGAYSITPSMTGYTFFPINRSINVAGENTTMVDFSGTGTTPSMDFSLTNLGLLEGRSTTAYEINNIGQVVGVGHASDGGIYERAFLYSNGTMMDIGTIPSYSWNYCAYDINDSGQIVGTIAIIDGSGAYHAFLYSEGTMTDLNSFIGGIHSFPTGINDSGQIVGYFHNSTATHAFLLSDNTMIDLGTLPGGNTSYAKGINNNGQVVGYSTTSDGATHAFLYSNGSMTDLGTLPGGNASYAESINDSGQVVGYSTTSDGATHAFLYSNGTMIDLGTLPGDDYSRAYGINNSGQVVGCSVGSNQNAFLYSEGTMYDLKSIISPSAYHWNNLRAYGINDEGQIVGRGDYQGPHLRAFLLTPIN